MKKLILVHGALGAGAQLETLKDYLYDDFETEIYEFPGHGQRALEDVEFSIEHLAADFHQWINAHHKEPVHVFGYSMGGYVSLVLQALHQDVFASIVTLGTKFKWNNEEALKEAAKLSPSFLEEKAPQYVVYLKELHGNEWEKVLLKTKHLMMTLGADPYLTKISCSQINCKTTLLLGELDKMVTREETMQVQGWITGSSYRVLDGFVHPLERLDMKTLATELISCF